jgi:NTP pyrophosphatase (non-canonical NTP hydrolase)
MHFDEYQQQARKTAIYPNLGNNFVYPTLGLCGEAGEVAEKIKKVLRDDGGVISTQKRKEIAFELFDIIWYIANLATELGLSLDTMAQENLSKLLDRKKRNVLKGNGDDR